MTNGYSDQLLVSYDQRYLSYTQNDLSFEQITASGAESSRGFASQHEIEGLPVEHRRLIEVDGVEYEVFPLSSIVLTLSAVADPKQIHTGPSPVGEDTRPYWI